MSPYIGARLATLFHTEPIDVALERMANRGGDRMVEWTVKNTPIGFPRGLATGFRGGNLRSSWRQKVPRTTRRRGLRGWESGVETDVDYAPDVEYGTGLWGPSHAKYVIEPKKPGGFLRWVDPQTGKDVFAKRVLHPGSPGQHMVAIAATMVEGEMRAGLFDDILEAWARETEALARA